MAVMALKVWNSKKNTAEEALNLPKGRYCADVGFNVEQSVQPDYTLEAAQALIDSGVDKTVASQAKLYVVAQESGVYFQDWGKLSVF